MTKDNRINIKLEVCKDKTSGKLSITAHFDSSAQNVIQNKDGYFWLPTREEKDFLIEAFELFPVDGGYVTPTRHNDKIQETKREQPRLKPEPEPISRDEPELEPEIKIRAQEETSEPEDLPPLEEPTNQPDVFSVTDEHIKSDNFEKEIDKKIEEITPPKDKTTTEEPKTDEKKDDKIDENEGFIVEADNDAIEEALKKHQQDDSSIVEADEKTIIDKVLSQKKKGKWSRK